nr:AAA family ATPase [Pseudoruegeria sp. HB172150]
MVVGAPGSGKSTLAVTLGQMTGLPVFHMDHIHWLSGWVEREKADKIEMAREIEARDAWIFEGGLASTYDSRAARSDLIVWLDLPLGLRLWRVVWRIVRTYGTQRNDLPEGCPEQVSPEFFRYILSSSRRTQARLARLVAEAGKPVRHLTSPRAVRRWVASVRQSGLPG